MSLVITDAGIAASINAQTLGVEYKITHIAIGLEGYLPTVDQTELKRELTRKPLSRGAVIAPGQLHFEAVFDDNSAFEGKEIGYFLEDGTLFAVDSRDGEILSLKRSNTIITEAFDLNLASSEISNITVEIMGTPYATETVAGIAKIIQEGQVDNGTDDSTFLTIKKLLHRTATTLRSGVVQLSNSYQGKSESKAVTEKALNDGLSSVYSPHNLPPLMLKQARLYPDDLTISLLPIGQDPKPEWIMPASASKVIFINVKTKVVTSENICVGFTIYCHYSESGGATYPSAKTVMYFSVPNFDTPFGVYNNFVVPITLEDGTTPKRLSFDSYSYGPDPSVVSKFEIEIDDVWESV